VRPTNSGARTDTAPMAILARAKPTTSTLPSIDRSYEIGGGRYTAAHH
jgi:hypothetical protein